MRKAAKMMVMGRKGLWRWAGSSFWRAAKAMTGDVVANVVVIGDSISAPTADETGYVALVRNALQASYGDAGRGMIPVYKTDWTFSAGWSDVGWGIASGLKQTTDAGNTASITVHGDSADIYWMRSASSAAFTVSVDGGAGVQYGSSGAVLEMAAHIDLGALGDHAIVITTGGVTSLDGIRVNIGTTGVQVHNCAKIGADTTSYTNNAFNLLWVDVLQPKLSIVALGVNDYGNQRDLATYQANLKTIIGKCQLYGSVFVLAQCYSNSSLAIPQSEYHRVQREIAASEVCGRVDIYDRWGGWAAANTAGYMADSLHPSVAGHASEAGILRPYL